MKKIIEHIVRKWGPLKFFVIIAAVFGMAFLLITPPFQGADEPVHFLRAYQVADGQIKATVNKDGKIGGYLPVGIKKIMDITDRPSVQFYPQMKYKEGATKVALEVKPSSQKIFYAFPAAAAYSPTAYPLSSLSIAVAQLLHFPTMAIFYAARLGNLLTWIILIGASIYLLPSRKWAMVAVGLLPMALFQASTLNGDAITLGTMALFLSLILKIRVENLKISPKLAALLLGVAIMMVLSKDVMFIFVPLILLIPKESFRTLWLTRLFKAVAIAMPLITFGLWLLITHDIPSTAAFSNGQDPNKQLHFILLHPHSYINVLWNTYFYTWGDSITRSVIGTFGWADTPLSEGIVILGYLGLALLLAGSYENTYKDFLSKKSKWLVVAMGILYWLAVSTALYVYYSPYRFKIIVGLQGRYYIPLLFLAIPLLRVRGIKIDCSLYERTAVLLPCLLLLCSVITLYVRYFINNV